MSEMTQADQPSRAYELHTAYAQLDESMMALQEACAEVERRLSAYVRHEPVAALKESDRADSTFITELARRVESTYQKSESCRIVLSSILSRLEI